MKWETFKQNTLNEDKQPFMAWRYGEVVHTAKYDPAYHPHFITWLRQQELSAQNKGATASCVTFSSGKTEFKKYK